uniref:Uncharacterized protein n=1 Tax=Lotus japonicus TaxID=34305 RepID=I3SIB1_LOTJA|nr:unknown [Lotus japonicus]
MNKSLWVGVVAASLKFDSAKWGSEISESHDLHTHLKRTRDFTGSLNRI